MCYLLQRRCLQLWQPCPDPSCLRQHGVYKLARNEQQPSPVFCAFLCMRGQAPGFAVEQSGEYYRLLPNVFDMPMLLQQDRGTSLASNQVQYSLLYRTPEQNGVKQACEEGGTSLIAYSPLAQGLLTGKPCTYSSIVRHYGMLKVVYALRVSQVLAQAA